MFLTYAQLAAATLHPVVALKIIREMGPRAYTPVSIKHFARILRVTGDTGCTLIDTLEWSKTREKFSFWSTLYNLRNLTPNNESQLRRRFKTMGVPFEP